MIQKRETLQMFCVRLSEADLNYLAKIAKDESATISDVVRHLISEYKKANSKNGK